LVGQFKKGPGINRPFLLRCVTTKILAMEFSIYLLPDDGTFPNSKWPLIIYSKVFEEDPTADDIKNLFQSNQWSNCWQNGIYSYHHYHSITHEVMGVCRGSCEALFGGDAGVLVTLRCGDFVIVPAGVAHKNLGSQNEFICVGAYPNGKEFDINYGKVNERPLVDANISALPVPDLDPVFGNLGKLHRYWR
jgi:uncharacterized protein YjlB